MTDTQLSRLKRIPAFCTSVREAMEEPSVTVQQKVLQINYHPQSGWFEDAPLKGHPHEAKR
jgi:hypothetical protein